MENRKAFWIAIIASFLTVTTCPIQETPRTINVWVTTDNQSQKLEPQPALSFSAHNSSGDSTIFV
ncbi:MAG TPA: hypothetical protein VGV87_26410, partial [Blastocatellia bacterium]|nr:hypothetical protein [Blastocatellia bacterium]